MSPRKVYHYTVVGTGYIECEIANVLHLCTGKEVFDNTIEIHPTAAELIIMRKKITPDFKR